MAMDAPRPEGLSGERGVQAGHHARLKEVVTAPEDFLKSAGPRGQEGLVPSLTFTSLVWPPRRTLSVTSSPGLCPSTAVTSASAVPTARPSIAVTTSPVRRPAPLAGPPERTWATPA